MHDPSAREIMGDGLDTLLATDTVGLLHQGTLLMKSSAVIQAIILCGFPFSLCALFFLVPVPFRDCIYDRNAKNRHAPN